MPFPETQRVIYIHNPLVEVVCQLKFPPNLSIETELPSEFQKSIAKAYPLYTERMELQIKLPEQADSQVASVANVPFPTMNRKNHQFLSADEKWKINLARDFIAFSTVAYTRWEEFKDHFLEPFRLFVKIYEPPFFTRIGLRYRDIITRSELGLADTPWTELLKPYILGLLSSEDVNKHILDVNHVTEIQLKDGISKVRIISGLVKNVEKNEMCYSIDSDFFILQTIQVEDAVTKLDFFNQRGSRLIQWCITEKLHNAMEPKQL